jgi:signal transduction histidine kinase
VSSAEHSAAAADALRAERDEALASASAKFAFLATMSHEIRTPLNAVIGMTDLLLDTDPDAAQQEFVEILRSSAAALSVITDEILDFSKIESGAVELESRPFEIRECVEGALQLFAQASAAKALSLVARLDPSCAAGLRRELIRAFLDQAACNLRPFARAWNVATWRRSPRPRMPCAQEVRSSARAGWRTC